MRTGPLSSSASMASIEGVGMSTTSSGRSATSASCKVNTETPGTGRRDRLRKPRLDASKRRAASATRSSWRCGAPSAAVRFSISRLAKMTVSRLLISCCTGRARLAMVSSRAACRGAMAFASSSPITVSASAG